VVSIQSSHTSFLKCTCSSPFGNLKSCSLLTPWLYSLNCFSCGNVICGISFLCSLSCLSYGDVICGTARIFLITCTTIGTANGSTLPLIILCALKSMLSCSFFILELEAPPSSTLLFLLRALLATTSASHYSISIALRCAFAIVLLMWFAILSTAFLWIVILPLQQCSLPLCPSALSLPPQIATFQLRLPPIL